MLQRTAVLQVSFISLELRESKDCMKAGEGKARDS